MTIDDPLLSSHSYQLLPLATSQLVGNNKEIHVSDLLQGVLLIGGGELLTIEDQSLSTHGYQLLHLVTSQLVGDNRDFNVSEIF